MNSLPQFESPSVLEIEDLEFRYRGGPPVISGCRLSVAAGEVLCVLGCSGGGKTTLLRLIAGLERSQGGSIRIDGEEIEGPGVHRAPERRRVGMVFQDFALFPNRSVLGNVMFAMGGTPRNRRAALAAEHLDRVGMLEYGPRMPHTLSGGQQQRVAIARAMARKPRVMLLDESFSSLDTETRVEVREETVRILREADVATVMVTHDPGEAESVGDRVSWLDACCRSEKASNDDRACTRE